MSPRSGPIANALDFRTAFQKAIGDYEGKVALRLRELQRAMDPMLEGRAVDAELEAHIRSYVIDPLLAALNWSTDENLTIEALVRSQETGTRRRLDYLGTESDTVNPLLVVEAKRPNAPKPGPATKREFTHPDILAEALTRLKQEPHKELDLQTSWAEWIRTLFDYVNSLVGPVPVRVAITNGDWLIVFEDPANAFKGTEPVSPDTVSFYGSRDDILKNANRVFALLNYDALAPLGRAVEVGQLLGVINPQTVSHVMRAARITYTDIQTGLGVVPTMHLVPELLLFRSDGGWLRVFANVAFPFPHLPAALSDHLAEMNAAHETLLGAVTAALGVEPPLITLEDAYTNGWLGVGARAVRQIERETHLAILGTHTHFVVAGDAHTNCPFHRAAGAMAQNAFLGFVIAKPSSQHMTHFGDQSPHHCAHRSVRQLREQQVADHNRQNFAPRGSVEDGPFCKLWAFEHYLCCQTCAFRNICTHSIGPLMPCVQEPA
jgi:hypothetical protein